MMLMGVTDSIMVGHVSPTALAAVALGSTYSMAVLLFGQGILSALDPIVAQAWGAGERHLIAIELQRGIAMALLLSVPYAAIFWYSAPILLALGQPPEIVIIVEPFLRAMALGIPAFLLFVALRQTLQAMGLVRPMLFAVIVGNAINVVGNWMLIYGKLGAPALGAVGSGWSTSFARWAMVGSLAWAARPALAEIWQPFSPDAIDRKAMWRMARIGVPIGLHIGLEMWVFTATAMLIGAMGPAQLAGHQVAINLASLSFMAPLGIGAAAATRVGNAIGRGDTPGMRRSALVALVVGGSVMLVSATAYALFPAELAHLYSPDAQVIATAAQLLPIAALFQIFDGTQAVGCGILRGAADVRIAAIINFVGYWILGLPIGWLLAFRVGLEARGLWLGLTLGLAVVAVAVSARIVVRFRHPIARV